MKVIILKDYDALSMQGAMLIKNEIEKKKNAVLGLATGATPLAMYNYLTQWCQDGTLTFKDVVTFNLDEYIGLDKTHPQSYAAFMNQHLFQAIDIALENTYIPNGKALDLEHECEAYEKLITTHNGIDLQVLGIGRNGHIGFNEPNTFFEPKTHLVSLDDRTIEDNARFFGKNECVPQKAISMGIQTIMRSRKIVLLASGENKAQAIYDMIFGKITPQLPASVLQLHQDVTVLCDEAAASKIYERRGDIC